MPSGFVSTLSTVMSQSSLTFPMPFPATVSSTSLAIERSSAKDESVSRTTSDSSTSSNASTTSKSSSSRTKNLFKRLKEHKDTWWTISAADRAEYNRQCHERPQPVVHEWNYMYL